MDYLGIKVDVDILVSSATAKCSFPRRSGR